MGGESSRPKREDTPGAQEARAYEGTLKPLVDASIKKEKTSQQYVLTEKKEEGRGRKPPQTPPVLQSYGEKFFETHRYTLEKRKGGCIPTTIKEGRAKEGKETSNSGYAYLHLKPFLEATSFTTEGGYGEEENTPLEERVVRTPSVRSIRKRAVLGDGAEEDHDMGRVKMGRNSQNDKGGFPGRRL